MHCIYKDNLVPYPMPGTILPGRGGISGSRQQLDLRYTSTTGLGPDLKIRILWMSACWAIWEWSVVIKNILIRYLSLRRMYLSQVMSGTPRYCTKTAPDPAVDPYRQGIWVISPQFRDVSREVGKSSYRATPRDAYEYF